MDPVSTNTDVHSVLCTYIIRIEEMCSKIIDNEKFQTLKGISSMETNIVVDDISWIQEMCVNLGMVQIKKVQALVWRI